MHNTYPTNNTPEGSGRNGAYREAKRASGIPTSQSPISQKHARNKNNELIPGTDYTFSDGKVIREHLGHTYIDDPSQNIGNLFNDTLDNHYMYNGKGYQNSAF
ncbi:hypothetical protein AGMMS49975_21980 [Clostridia bacterium]|nr:hypothetical protein AGMMS49975_21980 [Clostridia bacterium]